jgi:CheY-like chemotaxis protein
MKDRSVAIEQALLDGGASSVAICSSTDEAMAELHRQPPDALVLDVNLADRNDGWALAELVVELNPRQPRIVFSTGSPERIPPEIAELGQILAKPYDPAELVQMLMPVAGPNLIERLRGAIAEA